MEVLGKYDVQEELGLHMMRMSVEDAVMLRYTAGYSQHQWNQMAQAVNSLNSRLRSKVVTLVPSVSTMER
jgi:hypothetical protein